MCHAQTTCTINSANTARQVLLSSAAPGLSVTDSQDNARPTDSRANLPRGALSRKLEQAAGCKSTDERPGNLQREALGQAHLVHVREPLCILRHCHSVREWGAMAAAGACGWMPGAGATEGPEQTL